LRELAATLAVTPQAVVQLQHSEERESISLKRLREAAAAMECELVYALVPKTGKLTDVIEERNRKKAAERVVAVEHTMALENQAAGNVAAQIKEEQSHS
jgi:predicted DNA-binding mobile mystery protein A